MKKILIVDDDTELRVTLSEILSGAGYSTAEASSGKDALELVSSENFDVVLLDLMMPGMSGIDVLAELRRTKPRVRVIMITAFATIENAVEAIKKGASDYISKPFKINELIDTIRRVLEEARFEDGLKKLAVDQALNSLSNPIRRTIIQLLYSRTKMRLMEITRELNIQDHTKVVFHLKTLKEAGIIDQDDNKLYLLTREGERTVDLLKILESHLSAH